MPAQSRATAPEPDDPEPPRPNPRRRAPARITPIDREIAESRARIHPPASNVINHAHLVVVDGGGSPDPPDSPPPPPTTTTANALRSELSTCALADQLRSIGFVGARAWLRRIGEQHAELVAITVAEVQAAQDNGQRITNPAGLVRHLVTQEIAADDHPDTARRTPR